MTLFDWPDGFERAENEDRETTNKFETGIRQTKRNLESEMERLGVDEWDLDEEPGSGPSVVLRWIKGGQEFAVAADEYKAKKSNLRELYLWVNETRMRSTRKVKTGQDNFAAAALPSGDEEGVAEPVEPTRPPHEVLELSPDASDDAVKAVSRQLKGKYHPETGDMPDREEYIKVSKAKEAMLDE